MLDNQPTFINATLQAGLLGYHAASLSDLDK